MPLSLSFSHFLSPQLLHRSSAGGSPKAYHHPPSSPSTLTAAPRCLPERRSVAAAWPTTTSPTMPPICSARRTWIRSPHWEGCSFRGPRIRAFRTRTRCTAAWNTPSYGLLRIESIWGSWAVSWGFLVLPLEYLLASWLGSFSLSTQKPNVSRLT